MYIIKNVMYIYILGQKHGFLKYESSIRHSTIGNQENYARYILEGM